MWCSNQILAKYELIKDLFPIEVGEKIARGFADLGYEEFYLVTPTKMVSVFTAQTSILAEDQRHFFFVVPSFERLDQALRAQGWEVRELKFKDNRNWQLIICKDNQQQTFVTSSLEQVFLEALVFIVTGQYAEDNSRLGVAQAG